MKSGTAISLSIVGAGTLIALAVIASAGSGATGSPHAGNSAPVEVPLSPDDPVLGNADAPVTIIAFEDFECPFCARFTAEAEQLLIQNEIKEGLARIVWKDFPLSIHSRARLAHEAARCAQEQGKFWEYHDLLFGNQDRLGKADLKAYAKALGLDATAFDSCLDSGKYRALVQKGINEGTRAGVSGTPSFVINGTLVSGALPYEAFSDVIRQIAAGATN
ncbi:DsbA family protein [Candidatus Kaiserbacteria bacterium]|nr:DsbA family protein [Candidatus Kaiserbacteria bacterium]